MGQVALYKCMNCGHEFEASEGGGFKFIEYRCVDCDSIKEVKSNRMVAPEDYKPPSKKRIGKCEECGGKLRDGLKPMCPKCKSRDVKEKRALINYD